MQTNQEIVAYIGLDWGDQHHAVCVQAADGGPVDRLELDHLAPYMSAEPLSWLSLTT